MSNYDYLDIPDMAEGTVRLCSSDVEVKNAFKLSVPGDVIELAANTTFGAIYMKAGSSGSPNFGQFKCGGATANNATYTFANDMSAANGEYITFRSADPLNPATTSRIQVLNSSNATGAANCFRFENINIENAAATSALVFNGSYCRFYGTKKYVIPNDPASGKATNTRPHITYDGTLSDYKNWTAAEWKAKTDLAASISGTGHYIAHINTIAVQQSVHLIESSGGSDYTVVRDVVCDGFSGDVFRGNGDYSLFEDCWVRNGYNNDSPDHYDFYQIADSGKVYREGIIRNCVFIGWDASHGSGVFTDYGFVFWDANTDYTSTTGNNHVYGSDKSVYKAIQNNGPSSVVVDPISDANNVYWVIPNAIPTVEQGAWSSDDPVGYYLHDNVFLTGGFQGVSLGSGNSNIFYRNTLQFIAPPPGYIPPARVYDTQDTFYTTETRLSGGRDDTWSSVSENIYDINNTPVDDGDNIVVNHVDWPSVFVNAEQVERDFHVLENSSNTEVGPIWLRYKEKSSPVGYNTFFTSPVCGEIGVSDSIVARYRLNIGLESEFVFFEHGTDSLKLHANTDGALHLTANGTVVASSSANDISTGWHTVELTVNNSNNEIVVEVDSVEKINYSNGAFTSFSNTDTLQFFTNSSACSHTLNYIWVWYDNADFRKPDKMIYKAANDVSDDDWCRNSSLSVTLS